MIFKSSIARAFFFSLVLLASALAGSFSVAAQSGDLPNPSSIIQPQAYVSLQPVPRGSPFEIAVVARITPGFHINAHVPSEDYLIPTNITAELPPGIVLVEATYPRGIMRKFHFAAIPLRVYETSFTVRMKLRAAAAARIGPQKIALTVAYQACNESACLPPTKVPATVQVEIAAAETPSHPANTGIFSPASPSKGPARR